VVFFLEITSSSINQLFVNKVLFRAKLMFEYMLNKLKKLCFFIDESGGWR
jgi:hypothetical protein